MEALRSRILVVDDFEPWRRLVCSMLHKQPDLAVVGEAENGLEAIQKAAELNPDLVLLEIDLPKMNGLEAARRIGEAVHNAKILFVSQINDRDVIAAAMNDGAYGYVLKINAGAELVAAIKAVLRGEHFVGSGCEGQERP